MAFGDFTVTRASTKNVLGDAGLYVSVANDTPAFEFNTDGTYRGLLVEPGATNLALQSQAFNEAAWSKTDITVTANSIVSPDGATTADTITEGTAGTAVLAQNYTVSSGATATESIFVKYGGVNQWIRIRFVSGANAVNAWFDIQNGVAGAITGAGTGVAGAISVQNVGNGWYRCSATGSITGETSYGFQLFSASANSSTTRVNNSVYYLWQAQAETGSVATSPIVTTAGTASRVADVVSLTGASSLIGATEGTIYAEVVPRNYTAGVNRRILNIRVDGNNVISLEAETTIRRYSFSVTNGGVQQVGIISGDIMTDTIKLSGAYKVNDFAFYVNGSQIGTDVSGTVPNVTTGVIGLGIRGDGGAGTEFNGHIRAVALFPTRLANATLASITA